VEHTITKLADCEYELRIELPHEEATPAIEEAYEHARQTLTIEGFRKGKAPIELIRQRYGAKIEADALEKFGERLAQQILREHQLTLLSGPDLVDLQRSAERIGFTYRYATLPELTVDLSDIRLQKPVYEVSPEEVEAELENLLLRYGTVEEVEEVSDFSHEVTLRFQPMDPATGMPLLGQEGEELTVALYDEELLPQLREQLLHARRGESFPFQLAAEGEGSPQQYLVHVQAIRRIRPAEPTPEFVEQLSGGQLHTVEELREYLRQELQRQWDQHTRSLVRSQLQGELLRRYPFEPPRALVQSMFQSLVQSLQRGELRIPEEYARQGHEGIARFLSGLAHLQARQFVLELLLLRQYDVRLSEAEITTLAQTLGTSPETLKAQLREDPELYYDLQRRKLWNMLLEQVHVEPIAYADYVQHRSNP
jgi:trigger factor